MSQRGAMHAFLSTGKMIYFHDREIMQPCSFLDYLFYNLLLIRSFTRRSVKAAAH